MSVGNISDATTTVFNITSLHPNRGYSYYVQAIGNKANGTKVECPEMACRTKQAGMSFHCTWVSVVNKISCMPVNTYRICSLIFCLIDNNKLLLMASVWLCDVCKVSSQLLNAMRGLHQFGFRQLLLLLILVTTQMFRCCGCWLFKKQFCDIILLFHNGDYSWEKFKLFMQSGCGLVYQNSTSYAIVMTRNVILY